MSKTTEERLSKLTNYISGKGYRNRSGKNYCFKLASDFMGSVVFVFEHEDLIYCRYGGRDGQTKIDMHNLGMIDPSGGPYLAVEQFKIDGMVVENIRVTNDDKVLISCNY